ncbi:PAS domain-containing protein [Synechococcales cyanobacterium C]|uniref:histidine kinase n=1 Tax=Petrachloros mirabilis ULC683 TaxID=2781853 RepID=A0A8K1ZZV5_9CYAN|nr:PAS domain-containing protein [Petrachloros mirabilis]NCJ08219.1 PAS domain-containing protein [Petrachloros mirabilis ULC683]
MNPKTSSFQPEPPLPLPAPKKVGAGSEASDAKDLSIPSARELEQLFLLSQDMLCVADLDGHFKSVNPAFTQILGHSQAVLLTQPFLAFVHPDDQAATLAEIDKLRTGIPTLHFENRYRCDDGSYRWLAWMAIFSLEDKCLYAIARDITQRRQAEAEAQEQEQRIQLALQAAKLGAWQLDLLTQTLTISAQSKTDVGLPTDLTLTYTDWLNHIHADDRVLVREAVTQALANHTPYEAEYRVLWPDGSAHWILSVGQGVYDAEGQPLRLNGVTLDVTDHRHRSETLSHIAVGLSATIGDAFFQSLVEVLTEVLPIEYALIGELTPTQSLRVVAGWSEGQPLTLKDYALTHSPGSEVVGQQLRLYSQGVQQQFPQDEVLKQLQAESYAGVPLMDATGQALGLLAVISRQPFQDTQLIAEVLQIFAIRASSELERQRAALALQHQTERAQLFAELTLKIRQSLQLEDILRTVVTEVHRVLQADRVLIFQFWPEGSGGSVLQEAVSPGWSSVINESLRDDCFSSDYLRQYRDGRVYQLPNVDESNATSCLLDFLREFQVKSKLVIPLLCQSRLWGLLIAHQCAVPRHWLASEIELMQQLANQIGIALDQAALLERETQQRQELARSNEDLQQFAYVASHDLQEPLRMVTSYLQLLERRYQGQLDTTADEFIHYAVEGATRMQALIQALLRYSRLSTRTQPFQPVALPTVWQAALANLQLAIADCKAQVTCSPLPTVLGDATQLTQLLQNLLENALKFRRELPPKIHVQAVFENQHWRITVQDNGIGIAPEYCDRIFPIFQRLHTRAEYPGTGIGLALCKKIVEHHGGAIGVTAQLGQGSTFWFTLPAAPAHAAP